MTYPYRSRSNMANESEDEDILKWIKHVTNLISQEYLPNTISLNFHSPNLIMNNGDTILEDDVNPRNVYGNNLERRRKYDPNIFFDKGIVISQGPACGEDIFFFFGSHPLQGFGVPVQIGFKRHVRASVRTDSICLLISV